VDRLRSGWPPIRFVTLDALAIAIAGRPECWRPAPDAEAVKFLDHSFDSTQPEPEGMACRTPSSPLGH